MKIVFMGTTDFSTIILEKLIKHHQVSLVVTQPDRPFGRKQLLKASPVKELALKHNIEVFQPEKIKSDYQRVLDHSPDCIVVAAFGQMIPKIILDYPKYKSINVHASLLPKYRGGSPMHTAIKNGDTETGITIMYMAPKMDAGSLILQKSLPIEYSDTVGDLEKKLAVLGSDLLIEALDLVEQNKVVAIPQNEEQVTFAWNIKPEEEFLDFNRKSIDIYNHVRAFNPWPTAHLIIDSLKIKVFDIAVVNELLNQYEQFQPGQVVDVIKGNVYIRTLDGVIMIQKIQPAGKNVMLMKEFMNGTGKSIFYVGKLVK